jgi:hypothetical protein
LQGAGALVDQAGWQYGVVQFGATSLVFSMLAELKGVSVICRKMAGRHLATLVTPRCQASFDVVCAVDMDASLYLYGESNERGLADVDE